VSIDADQRRRQRVGAVVLAVVVGAAAVTAWPRGRAGEETPRDAGTADAGAVADAGGRRLPDEPAGWVTPEARAAVLIDLAALRAVPEVGALLGDGDGDDCAQRLLGGAQWAVGMAAAVPVDDLAVVVGGASLVPAAVSRCAVSRASAPTEARALRYRGLQLSRVAPAAPEGGAPPRASLLLAPGTVLLGPTEALYAALDAALASAEHRAEPTALAPLLDALPPPAGVSAGTAAAVRAAWWSAPPAADDVLPRVRGVGLGLWWQGAARVAARLRCDDATGAAETAATLAAVRARDGGVGALPLGLSDVTATASGREVRVEGRVDPAALRALLGAVLARAPGRAPSPPTGRLPR
jgi:hypothetical protein